MSDAPSKDERLCELHQTPNCTDCFGPGVPTSKQITAEHEQALTWARGQNFGSVSARYAKLCAEAYDIARSAVETSKRPPHCEREAKVNETSTKEQNADPTQRVRELLDSHYWLPGLRAGTRYARTHDDCDGDMTQQLSIVISEDGDAWVACDTFDRTARFRHGLGGGRSHRVRNALLILAEAIRLDNEERP